MTSTFASETIKTIPAFAFEKPVVSREPPAVDPESPTDGLYLANIHTPQGCKSILLHYACKSTASTEKLFKAVPDLVKQPRSSFLLLPSASLERVASVRSVMKMVDMKIVDQMSMLMLHWMGVLIITLFGTFVRLAYLMRLGVSPPRLAVPITFAVLAATALLALEITQARAMHAKVIRSSGRGLCMFHFTVGTIVDHS